MHNKFAMDAEDASFYERFSHELRTVLTSVVGFSEYIEYTVDDPMMKFAAQVVHGAGHDVQRITAAYFDLIRLDLGEGRLQPSIFSVVELVQEVVLALRELAKARSVKLVLNADEGAWSVRMVSDASVFQRALELLLHDWLVASAKNDVIQVDVCSESLDDTFKLKVVRQTDVLLNERWVALSRAFWLDRAFSYDKQEGPGVSATLAKRFIKKLSGYAQLCDVPDNAFGLELVFPLQVPQNVR